MSLREEMAKELEDECFVKAEHDEGEAWAYCMLRAEDLTNKILDAVVNTCEAQLTYDEYDPARTFIEAINKLRSES